MRQITVLVENKPGELSAIFDTLEKAGVDIQFINADALGTSGMARIITDSGEAKIRNAMKKMNYGFFVESDVVPIRYKDVPSELGRIFRLLARNKVNVEAVHRMGMAYGEVDLVLRVDKVAKARKVLRKYLMKSHA